ncbi:MAG: TIGR03862 family flavoprotein [Sphingobacteriales bacterium]|nr:MAG: TIGR03862 family flavoprotein [Sphingobacteriales bacterium]
MKSLKRILIAGTGPAALMAGTFLLEAGHEVTFYEQKKAAGRKFLVAGHGGFNLSNSIDQVAFLEMYDREEIREMVKAFDMDALVLLLRKIGIPTYTGSSGKIFPEPHIKPIDVLNAWLGYLKQLGATFRFGSRMVDFDTTTVQILSDGKIDTIDYDKLVLALGGASWSKTGATGAWAELFHEKGIETIPFAASNAGFEIHLPETVLAFHGQPVKHVVCRLGEKERYGEIVLTGYGFEGAPVFYLNGAFRNGHKNLNIDAKPGFDLQKVIAILSQAKNPTEGLKQLKLAKPIIAYVKHRLTKEEFMDINFLGNFIKNIPFKIEALRPVEEAISTVGGLSFEEVNNDLSLKKFPNIYCCGEMLDWDAPTGGYLLQACFASGAWVGKSIK